MVIRSVILYKEQSGKLNSKLKGSYFYFDGHLEYVGATLLKHYNSAELAKSLVDYSPSCRSLRENLDIMTKEGVTYNDGQPHYMFDNEDDLIKQVEEGRYYDIEFFYLFDNNEWQVAIPNFCEDGVTCNGFVSLKEAIKKD